jgi:serine/threonine protein kinase
MCPPDALDLLKRMMVIDHRDRITAHEALAHPFFDRFILSQPPAKNGTLQGRRSFAEI